MYENNIFNDDERSEGANEQRECGRIGAMMDGMVVAFTFRDLRVSLTEREDSIVVSDLETGEELGGVMSLRHATVMDVHNWLENKAALYGGT